MNQTKENTPVRSATLLMHCPDTKGIVVTVTEFIFENRGNILYLDQHVDAEKKVFFMRIEWDLAEFLIPADKIGEYFQTLVAQKYGMNWTLSFSDEIPKMAVFVSEMPHCLFDLIARYQSGEWRVDLPLIISNHETLRPLAERFGIEFQVYQIDSKNKADQEAKEMELLAQHQIDFIVLARYMQVLTPEFITHYPGKIINIHHSFLPAFPGAKPYHSAYERGVKIIGATSHYVSSELDAGPIIEQDVVRVSHADSISDLIRKGRDLEKVVLSRAIWLHLGRKILAYDNRTVIFV